MSNVYENFTLCQLGEGYKHHVQQDCKISQRMAKEILDELIRRKGQRAAKIRNAFGLFTRSVDNELWIFESQEDDEPLCIIHPNKEIGNIYAPEWLLDVLEYLA